MKLFLDNKRKAPKGWIQVRWPEDAINLLHTLRVRELSLDDELAEGTGLSVLQWMDQVILESKFRPPKIMIHASNPETRTEMDRAMTTLYCHYASKSGDVLYRMLPPFMRRKGAAFRRELDGMVAQTTTRAKSTNVIPDAIPSADEAD